MDYAIFKGKVIFDKMNPALEKWLKNFFATRHYRRNVNKLKSALIDAKINLSTVLPPLSVYQSKKINLGKDSVFFTMDEEVERRLFYPTTGILRQPEYLIDYNMPPDDSPGLWCPWYYDYDALICNPKLSYDIKIYAEWLRWLINHVFSYADIKANGVIERIDDQSDDVMLVVNNNITIEEETII